VQDQQYEREYKMVKQSTCNHDMVVMQGKRIWQDGDMQTVWEWQWKVTRAMQANLEGCIDVYELILGFWLGWLQGRLLFVNQLSNHLIFSVSDFELVFDELIFNGISQSKVENWTTPSMDLLKTDGTKYMNDL
jgi:hypothetical protein